MNRRANQPDIPHEICPGERLRQTLDYVVMTDSVLRAGWRLQKGPCRGPDPTGFAVSQLEQAAESQESGAVNYGEFMFYELEGPQAGGEGRTRH